MEIMGYIVGFVILGFVIDRTIKTRNIAMGVIVVISILWAFIFEFWAIATFVELMAGYALSKTLSKTKRNSL